ncbi:hypothetical protein QTH97_36335 [Variovorax sp. J22R24]|uniref:hypothetical protein n=1 Tax=Variovorax gracilis TaxID=3053502 RepID=UPI0025758AFE|nr:hypothetical protein [Variovorax sp. J22R24]MDM0110401.1 hypothetical protein [Variovorax sp. J22R24]
MYHAIGTDAAPVTRRAGIDAADEEDYCCTMTLTEAAEEILGKLPNKVQEYNALNQLLNLCMFIPNADAHEGDDPPKAKTFIAMANAQRDVLKHIRDGADVAILKADAIQMLERSVASFMFLTGRDAPLIVRYLATKGSHAA